MNIDQHMSADDSRCAELHRERLGAGRSGGASRRRRGLCGGLAVLGLLVCAPPTFAQTTCGNLITNEENGTFGTLPLPGPPQRRNLQNPQVPNAAGYVYQFGDPVGPGDYAITSRNYANALFPTTTNHWENMTGHNAGGPVSNNDAYLAVNGLTVQGQTFYSQNLVLVGGQSYTLSVWAANAVVDPNPNSLPRIGVRVRDLATNAIVPGGDTTTIVLPSRPNNITTQWFQATVTFTVPGDGFYRYELYNGSTAFAGNDFSIDDMSLTASAQAGCPVDFGDAPDTGSGTARGNYQTLLSDNGPRHGLIAGLFLGANATEETDALQNANATGDVDNGIGTLPNINLQAGTAVSIPITALNLSGTAASVRGFIDFNRDGDFGDAGEISAVVAVPNQNATTTAQAFTLNFTVPAGAVPGPAALRVRLARDATEIATAIGSASTGEVEDSMVTLLSTLVLTKTWTGAIAGNRVNLGVAATGATGVIAGNSIAAGATTNARATMVTGVTATLTEAFTVGNAANYLTTLACTLNTDGSQVAVTGTGLSRTIVVPEDGPVTCTYTNARVASLTMRKQWGEAVVGDDATITVARGATVIDTFNSDAGAANELDTDATPTTVGVGETLTLAETLEAANAGLYDTTLACTGAADTNPADGLTIGAADTAIVCTYTNTRRVADLSITKTNTPAAGALDQANDTVDSAQATTYTLVVTNDGATEVTGAVVRDAPGAGITCPPGNAVSITGAGVPAGSFTVADLTGANGIVLGALAAGQSTTLSFNCQVN